jgi:hypothetical protein
MLIVKIISLAAVFLFAQASLPETVTGSYKILVDEKPAGVERFERNTVGQSLIMKSSTEVTVSGLTQKVTALTELYGSRLLRYELETATGDRIQKYSMRFESGVARVVIEAYGRQSERAVAVSRDVMLLDKNVWHHYGLLINRYDMNTRGAQRFPVITPQSGLRQYIAEVEFKDKTTFNAEGQKLKANRFTVLLDEGYEVEVVADESNRVLSIEVPAFDAKAVLQLQP